MKRYFIFEGTATRSQYWMRTLAFLGGSIALIVLSMVLEFSLAGTLFAVVWIIVWLWVLLAVSMRRCREAGINPRWAWLWLLYPGAGNVFYIVLGCLIPDDGKRLSRPPKKPGLSRYLRFEGYATRQEYWCINLVIMLALGVGVAILGWLLILIFGLILGEQVAEIMKFLFTACLLLMQLWLSVAVAARRCRDATINLWWVFVYAIFYALFLLLVDFTAPEQSLQQFFDELGQGGLQTAILPINILLIGVSLVLSLAISVVFGSLRSQEKA